MVMSKMEGIPHTLRIVVFGFWVFSFSATATFANIARRIDKIKARYSVLWNETFDIVERQRFWFVSG